MPSLGSAYVQVRGDFNQLNKQLVANLHPSRLGKFGKAAGIGIGVGLAAGVAGKGLFDLGSQFDEQFDKIRVGTGATGQALEGLQEDFKAVAKSTPADFGSIGDAVTGLNQRLNLTGKPLQTLAKQITELSRITGTSVQENVATITRLFGDWGVQTGKQSSQLDKLFRVTQRTGIPLARLSDLMVQFGAPLRQLGFGFDEAATMFGKFEKEGVNLATILPGFRFALKNLSAPSGEAADALKKLGIAAKDPKVALQEVMAAIKDAPSNLKANAIAFAIFGKRAGPDMAAAIREGRFEYDGLLNQIRTGSDTIKKAGKDTRDFGEEWQLLKNQLAVTLEPIASDFFEAIGDGLKFLRTHQETVKTFARIVGVLTAAFVSYRVAVGGAAAATRAYAVLAGTAATQSAVAATATTAAGAQATAAGAAAGGAAGGFKTLAARMIGVATGAYIGLEAGKALGKEFSEQGQGNKLKGFTKIVGDLSESLFKIRKPSDLGDLFKGSPTEEADKRAVPFLKAQREELFKNAAAEDRIRIARDQARASIPAIVAAERRLVTIRAEGKGGTHAEAVAIRALDAAQGARLAAVRESVTAEKEAERTAERGIGAAFKAYEAAKQQGLGARDLAKYIRGVARANSNWYASQVNITRAMRGLTPVTEASKRQLGDLLRTLKGVKGIEAFKKFTVTADISSVNAAIRLTSKLQDMGRVKTALKIIADAKSPEQALERLRKKLRDLEDRRHRFLVEMRDEATLRLDRLIRKVGDLPRGKITVDVVGGRMSVATKLERALADALTRIGQGQAGKAFKIRPQRGGMIPGTGEGDKVPALLEPGEGVINKKAVRAMGGSQVINRINRRVPRFQRGGFVRPVSASSLPHQRAGKEQSDVEANYHDQRSQRNLLERHGSILRLARTLGIPAFATGGVVRREPISPTAKIVKTGDKYAVVDGKQVVRVVDSLRDIDRSRTDSSPVQSIRDIRDATLREAITKAATERSTSKDTSSIVDRSAIHTTAEKALSKFAQVRDVATSSLREAITDRHDSRVSRDTLRDISRTKELRETLKGVSIRLRASSDRDHSHVSERVLGALRTVREGATDRLREVLRSDHSTSLEKAALRVPSVFVDDHRDTVSPRSPDHVARSPRTAAPEGKDTDRTMLKHVLVSEHARLSAVQVPAGRDGRDRDRVLLRPLISNRISAARPALDQVKETVGKFVAERFFNRSDVVPFSASRYEDRSHTREATRSSDRERLRDVLRESSREKFADRMRETVLSGRDYGRLGIASHPSGGQGGGLAAHADPRPESTEATHRVANIASNVFESVRSRLSTDQRLSEVGIQVFAEGGTVKKADKPKKRTYRQSTRELAERIWEVAGPLYPGAGPKMPRLHLPKQRQGQGGVYTLFPSEDSPPEKRSVFLPRRVAKDLLKGENYVEQTLLHEWTHVFQRPSLENWEAEGGATAFARRIAPKVFKRLRRPFVNPTLRGDPYQRFVRHVKEARGEDWIAHGQFAADPQASKKLPKVKAKMAAGGVMRKTALALVGEQGPEIAELPVGTRVHSHPISKRIAKGLGIQAFAKGGVVRPKRKEEDERDPTARVGQPDREKRGAHGRAAPPQVTAARLPGGVLPRANKLDRLALPYVLGGGHGNIANALKSGFDCSGAVSYVLGIPARVSGNFGSWGKPGPGEVSTYANRDHMVMSIAERLFGTGDGTGPHWLGGAPAARFSAPFTTRHIGKAGERAAFKGGGQGEKPKGPQRFRKLSLGQYVTVAKQVGFPDPALAAAIFYAESMGNVGAENHTTKEWSLGGAQVNVLAHKGLDNEKDRKKLQDDIFFNFREAKKISGGGKNFKPWTMYTNHKYEDYLGKARRIGPQKLPSRESEPGKGSSLAEYFAYKIQEAEFKGDDKAEYRYINRAQRYWRRVLRRSKAMRPPNLKRAGSALSQLTDLRDQKKALREEIPEEAFELGGLSTIGQDVLVPAGKRFPGSGPPPSKDHTWDASQNRWTKEAVFKSRRVSIGGIQKTLDRIDLDIAQAALTETFDGNGNVTPASYVDDIKAATEFVNVWTGIKQLAFGEGQSLTSGTIKQKTQAATELKSARDALKSVQDEAKSENVELAGETDVGRSAAQEVQVFSTAISDLLKTFGRNFQSLQSFAKGGISRLPLALVGEQGPELAKFPSGKQTIVGGAGPEIRELPAQTRIFSHTETKRKLGERISFGEQQLAKTLGIQPFAAGGTVAAIAPREDPSLLHAIERLEAALRGQKPEVHKNINQHITMTEPAPSGHAFAKSTLFELEAA